MYLQVILSRELKWLSWQGRWNGFQSIGAMEQRKVLSATMIDWQEKFWIVDALERPKQQHLDLGDSLLMKISWSAPVGISSEWL